MLAAKERGCFARLLFVFVVSCCCSAVAAEDDHDRNGDQHLYESTPKARNVTTSGEISEFPEDLFTLSQRRHGAIILHIILCIYCFVAIATVCTEHFLPTIRSICRDLKISDDVAAATFMSVATACPELFSNIMGTFVTKSDIGIGHVLGNAFYDMFFVTAVAGLAARKTVVLDWWPVTRDCIVYMFVAIELAVIVWDGVVTTTEALSLLASGVAYFIIMFSNRSIICVLRRFNINVNDPVENQTEPKTGPTEEHMELEVFQPTDPPVFVAVAQPKEENKYWRILKQIFLQPLYCIISLTVPRKKEGTLAYVSSFFLSICWIAVCTYEGTWMISIIGETIGVPDSIMGMVFMAAGGSVVEVYAVFYKVRRGECSIGLSNSMGCNTLDITFCLALPWLVRSLITIPGSSVQSAVIHSVGMQFNAFLLVACVFLLFLLLSFNRFRLNTLTGVLSGFFYVSILTFAIWREAH